MKPELLQSMRKGWLTTNQSGFSLVEVILASSVFVLLVTALVGSYLYGQEATVLAGNRARANMLAEEGLEVARNIRDSAWNEFTYSQSTVGISSNQWNFSGEGSSDTIDGFTRIITFSDVCRDGSFQITACPGTYTDPHTKRAVSTVTWQQNPQRNGVVVLATELTSWNSTTWTQTNWVGGAGQSIWSDATKYDSGINVDHSTSDQLQLAAAADGTWSLSGGTTVTDTSETDFNQGTYSNTAVTGSGSAASVILTQSSLWTEHANSGVVGNNLFSLDAVTASDIWAVGASGKIIHYNGTSWSEFADTGTNVNGIDMVSASDGWAVGNSDKIWHYNGTSWSEFADLGGSAINDIVMLSASSGWAVGDSDKFYRYNGTNWSEFVDLGGSAVFAVSAVSASDIWAVGALGKFYHYNGTSWSEIQDVGGTQLNDIFMFSASDGWAVGNNGEIYHYNGSTWSAATSPVSNDLKRLYALSASDIWAVGASGKILHYNGTSWSEFTDIGGTALNGVFFNSATDGWAVGNGGAIYQYGTAYNASGTFQSRIFDSGAAGTTWNTVFWTEVLPNEADVTISTRTGNTATPDGSWSSWSAEVTDPTGSDIASPTSRYLQYRITLTRGAVATQTPQLDDISIIYGAATSQHLYGIYATSASDVWAVGGNGVIVHYNGTSWSLHTDTGNETWNDIVCTSASNCWAVGNSGALAQYNGTSWIVSTIPSSANINAIYALSASDIWAAGASGRLWHYNDTSWSLNTDTGNETWNDIVCTSASNCWAVGNSGALAQYNGTSWIVSTISPSQNIKSVFALSASNIWATGASGNIWNYKGTAWSLHTDTGNEDWEDMGFANSSDGWAVNNNGGIRRWLGSSWVNFTSPTSRHLNAVAILSAQIGWAVGNNGTILRFSRSTLYETSGTATSSAFNMSDASPVEIMEWDESKPANTNIQFQIRTALNSGGSPGVWTSWYGVAGAGSYFTNHFGSLISALLNGNQWVQYRVELSGNGMATPILTEVRVNYK